MKAFLATLAILGTVVGPCLGLRCFVCNSANDSACHDELAADSSALINAFVQECEVKNETQVPFCRKVKENIYKPPEIRVHRECGYMRREEYDCYQKRAEDYVLDVCQCDKDLCNSSSALTASIVAVFLSVLMRFV